MTVSKRVRNTQPGSSTCRNFSNFSATILLQPLSSRITAADRRPSSHGTTDGNLVPCCPSGRQHCRLLQLPRVIGTSPSRPSPISPPRRGCVVPPSVLAARGTHVIEFSRARRPEGDDMMPVQCHRAAPGLLSTCKTIHLRRPRVDLTLFSVSRYAEK